MKAVTVLVIAAVLIGVVACLGGGSDAEDRIDIEATVDAAVALALPTETPTPTADINATITAGIAAAGIGASTPTAIAIPTPDLNATVQASLEATLAAEPTAIPTQPPTPDLDATVEARMAATIAAMPTPTPAPTATPVPTTTPTPSPTATRRPTSTPRPTRTPIPTTPPVAVLSEMVKRVRPAVVRIETTEGNGTGVIFETQARTGFVVTNYHVVEGFGRVRVVVNDSSTYQGTVRGVDPVRDLAVVSICCGSFHALPFGDASDLEAGDEVVAIGYALGLSGEATITRGIVSARRYDSAHLSEVIQTDAAINPGNSGGPMLSPLGEILGINTFRYDESESGRPAEGLGFAISEKTVQARIPLLKTAMAAPTPTPTLRPRPTPSNTSANEYGPVDGELRHDPSDGFIKTEYADVYWEDFLVSATFKNPYSSLTGPWDYGLIVRDTGVGTSAQFLQVVVTSDRYWTLQSRERGRSQWKEISEGRLDDFDTNAGGENTLAVIVVGNRGLFFVNGEFTSALDLSAVAGAGDVAVITGAYEGDERAGATTGFEEFQVTRLQKVIGPVGGRLQAEPGFVAERESGTWTQDFVAEAEFDNPRGNNWDYGFTFRSNGSGRLEVVGLTDSAWWFHRALLAGDDEYTEIADDLVRSSGAPLQSRNHLLLVAFGDLGLFFINDHLVARLDLTHNLEYGGVAAMGDFFNDSQGSPRFSNFNVWTP